MPAGKLVRLVGHNINRNRREFALSSFGIVIGIAAFVFFLSLSMGVRSAILELFPLDEVEVIAPRASLAGLDLSKKLDDATVDAIRAQRVAPVASAMPRMGIQFPMMISGYWGGQRLVSEYIGDGIDPEFLEDPALQATFRDWESAEAGPLDACEAPDYACEALHYCDRRDFRCHHNVPVLISPALLEIFNKQYAPSRKLPVIGADIQAFIRSRGLKAMRLYFDLGDGQLGGGGGAPSRRVEGTLVGVSDQAIALGGTMPLPYIRRWNEEYSGPDAARHYSSVVVALEDKDDVARFGAWVMKELDLRLEDSQGERFSLIITVVTLLFVAISLIIVLISAINIAHIFFMQVSERRREIGLMRALGASRRDVKAIIVGEAAVLGVLSGVVGHRARDGSRGSRRSSLCHPAAGFPI